MLDVDHDFIAILQQPLGIAEPPDARRRAGGNHVARLESERLRAEAHQGRDAKDHLRG
jgi:hypothetical protein